MACLIFVMMNTRLTLLLNKGLVERAKEEALERGTTLSKFIEKLLEGTFQGGRGKGKRVVRKGHPDVERLVGVIELPKDFDEEKAREEYLREKFGL